jgi:hypothetical protein
VLEDANTAQLAEGLDSDGRDITPEYAPLTVELKQLKGYLSLSWPYRAALLKAPLAMR